MYISTLAVVAAFGIIDKGKRRARITLEGSKGSIDGMLWSNTLGRLEKAGRLPEVGDIVGVTGSVRETTFRMQTDDDMDDETVTDPTLELSVDEIWCGEFDDEPTGLPGPVSRTRTAA